jgi:hypothetical protein
MFKEGDKVYDSVNFPGIEGVVVQVDRSERPYCVRFGDTLHWYYVDGRFSVGAVPTLSHEPYDPPKVVIYERPQFKAGDKVLVRDEGTCPWRPSIYRSFEQDSSHQHWTAYGTFKYCIPFDINLWNTTDKPKD